MTLLALAAAWVAGVFLADRFDLDEYALGLFLIASLLLTVLLVLIRWPLLTALLLVVVVLGMLRVEVLSDDETSALAAYHGHGRLQAQGVVAGDPEAAGAATRLRLRVDQIMSDDDWTEISGDVLVTLRESAELTRQRDKPYFRYGDRLLLVGTLESPPELEDFDYPAYLARQGIESVSFFPEATLLNEGEGTAFYRWLYSVRRSLADSLAQVLPEPQASLGQALLLGLRDNLPQDMVDDFRSAGASHVLAISGLHVGILLGITLAISGQVFGRRRQLYLVLPLVLMWLYALMSGMSPSVTRAAIMGSVYLAALFLGRPRSVLPALGFAAAVMVAINPDVIGSVSFQLSFAAMAGIAVLAEPLARWIQAFYTGRLDAGAQALLAPVSYIAAMTIAATLAAVPLVAFHFQQVSLVGLPTTILVLPALPFVLILQAVSGLIGLLSTGLAEPLGWLAWLASAYVTGVVGLIARLPGASVETGSVAPLLVWAYYGILAVLYAGASLRRRAYQWLRDTSDWTPSFPLAVRGVPWWVLAPVISVAALVWIAALSRPDSRLHVVFVDVGQGDAIFISTPSGKQILVDGGPDPLELVQFLGKRMPFRDRTIELVVLTHPHADHVNGLLEVLRRYDVKRILERQFEQEGAPDQAWRRAVEEEGAEVVQAESGQTVAVGGRAFMQVINPPARLFRGTSSDVNNASVVLKLVYGDVSFLLTGDMSREAEAALVASGVDIDSDVLKVGHHGSRSSSSSAFLDSVSPAVAVISVGQDNRFGHPHREVLEAFGQRVTEEHLLLTSERGTIELIADGKRLKLKTER